MILRSSVVRLLLHAMFVSNYVLLSASGRICCQSSHSTAQFALTNCWNTFCQYLEIDLTPTVAIQVQP